MNSPIVIFALCFAASQINPAFAQDIEPATPPVISTDRTNIDVQICKGPAATHPFVPFPACIQIIDLQEICPYAYDGSTGLRAAERSPQDVPAHHIGNQPLAERGWLMNRPGDRRVDIV